MKAFALLLCLSFAAMSVLPIRAESPAPDASLCGPYPKLYKEIVWNWMQKNLVDANSAKIEWQGDPKCTDVGKNGQHAYGWLVNFPVKTRKQVCVYNGKTKHRELIIE